MQGGGYDFFPDQVHLKREIGADVFFSTCGNVFPVSLFFAINTGQILPHRTIVLPLPVGSRRPEITGSGSLPKCLKGNVLRLFLDPYYGRNQGQDRKMIKWICFSGKNRIRIRDT